MFKKVLLPLLTLAATFHPLTAQPNSLENGVRDNISLTLYSNGIAYAREMRHVSLPVGEGSLMMQDIPSNLIASSVHVQSVNQPDAFHVLEQDFAYDTLSPTELMNRFVGKDIQLEVYNAYQDRSELINATVLSNSGGVPVYKIGDKIYAGHHGRPVFPMSDDLSIVPTLIWKYHNGTEAQHRLELAYLTRGISWTADYNLLLQEGHESGLLSGWVTINNLGSASFPEAEVALMAGEVHEVSPPAGDISYAYRSHKMELSEPQARPVFDYELFPLPRLTSIEGNQSKQVPLFRDIKLRSSRKYVADGVMNFYNTGYRASDDYRRPVKVFVVLDQVAGKETAIPAGSMRVYTEEDGQRRWVGEDRMPHTPKGESVEVRVGNAFDIIAEQRQTDYTQLSSRLHSSSWAWELKNKKDEAVTVLVQQRFPDNWQVEDSSQEFTTVDASTIQFEVEVPAQGDHTLTYRVQVGI